MIRWSKGFDSMVLRKARKYDDGRRAQGWAGHVVLVVEWMKIGVSSRGGRIEADSAR